MDKSGSLVVVGTGVLLGGHITPRAKNAIIKADVVFMAVAQGITEKWIESLHPDVRSLQDFYEEGKPRTATYKQMIEVMMTEIRRGKNVCGAFYGHPGVFALAPHKVIESARKEGFQAVMEPGVSAEDCLFADLGIDPGRFGTQQYEASQFMMFERRIDNSAYLILWQIGVAGDMTYTRTTSKKAYLSVLVDQLASEYPKDHEVIIYEAQTLPTNNSRVLRLTMSQLPDAELFDYSTLVVPPSRPMKPNKAIIELLESI